MANTRKVELTELTKNMIDGALDDDLDNMYEPYYCEAIQNWVPASKIIKSLYPEKYKEYFQDYIDRNNIILEQFLDGTVHYFEITEE